MLYELLQEGKSESQVSGWSLGCQEWMVYQINTHIEALWAAQGMNQRVIRVENDAFVDPAGYGTTRLEDSEICSGPQFGKSLMFIEESQVNSSGLIEASVHGTHREVGQELQSVAPGGKPMAKRRQWKQIPMLPLATSRLQVAVEGKELVLSRR